MAPAYKPLALGAFPAGLSSLFQEEAITLNDALKEAEGIQSQELANDINQVRAEEIQRQAAQEEKRRTVLQEKFGNLEPGVEFDPDEALRTAQRLALQDGDLDTALSIERTQRSRRTDQAYGDEERALIANELGYDLPAGVSPGLVNTLMNIRGKNTYAQQVGDPLLRRNRELNAEIKEQDITGTRRKPLSDTQLDRITANDDFIDGVNDTRAILNNAEPGAFSALKAGKITDLYKDPNSDAYRLYARLELLKKQVARMNDSGALTQLDVEMFAPLTYGSPIYDSKESIAARLNDLEAYAAKKRENVIENNERAYRNVDNFKIPKASPPPDLTEEEAAYKEQYKAKLRAQGGR
jgi:hypothetical protein